MLKIKDLKKKKKGKKGKHKDDELFTAEELEQYRREHQLKEQQQQQQQQQQEEEEVREAAEEGGNVSTGQSESDEWRKFKALTGGVDDILKKTQGDLDRIKSTSFFQRKPTPSELAKAKESAAPPPRPTAPAPAAVAGASKSKKRWVGFEEGEDAGEDAGESDEEEHEVQHKEPQAEPEPVAPEPEPEPEEEEEEEEVEEGDDIFDTSYVDVVTSGEVKLAYVPDSPVEEETGDDPFDTSYADKLVRSDDIERAKKKSKLETFSLGCAVEVLTGKVEKPDRPQPPPEASVATKRPRAGSRRTRQVDLLLGSFDEDAKPPATDEKNSPVEEAPSKSILDDELLGGVPDDLPPVGTSIPVPPAPSPAPSPVPHEKEEEKRVDVHDIVSEFEEPVTVSTDTVVGPLTLGLVAPPAVEEPDEFDEEFAALAAESIAKKGQPEPEPEEEVDPFDTSIATALLVGEPPPPPPPPPDVDVLLSGPPSSWSAFDDDDDQHVGLKPVRPPPPRPAAPAKVVAVPEDPFDTSACNILPGKVELKLLEKEIIGSDVNEARILSNSDSDFDFNPREGETPAAQTGVNIQVTGPAGLKESPDGDPFDDEGTSGLRPIGRDLLGGSTTDLSTLADEPIAPAAVPVSKDSNPLEDVEDPFDTSKVDVVAAPGKAELKFIEKEVLGDASVKLKRGLSDEEFDPRAEEANRQAESRDKAKLAESHPAKAVAFILPLPTVTTDLLAEGHEEGTKFSKPLTPYYAEVPPSGILNGDADSDVDPFDTSHATSSLEPGKAVLKAIESELLAEHSPASPSVCPIAPLLNNPKARSVSDTLSPIGDTADKYAELPVEKPESPKDDLFQIEEDVATKPLTPCVEDNSFVDPFDTSIASDIKPGKAELKLLEKELITGELKPISKSYSDQDFNPRGSGTQAPGSSNAAEAADDVDPFYTGNV